MRFEDLALCEPILRSLKTTGYETATPIQQKAIPKLLAGRDILGCAQTGTGKTAAFTLPTLHRLEESSVPSSGGKRRRQGGGNRVIRALVLAPTRELAGQVGQSLMTYGKHTSLRYTVIFGGVPQGRQVRALQSGVDVLVATPGRLLDLVDQGFIDLSAVEVLILDEADQMLDMGFIHDLRRIVTHVPEQRQTLMFSATMPKQIRELAKQWLTKPIEVNVSPVSSTPRQVTQSVCFVERGDKAATLTQFLHETPRSRTLVFSRTKHGADKIARNLQRDGIRAVSIHGNKSHAQRQAAIRKFNSPTPTVLVATDLASRGLDFSSISHVINFDLPDTPEVYVHRIGRTGRAGASGQAISFCSRDERNQLRSIERLTGQPVPVQSIQGKSGEVSGEAMAAPAETVERTPAPAARSKPRSKRRGAQHSSGNFVKTSGRSNDRPKKKTRKPRRPSERAV
ncbi:ATP-dependent RNA helicase RhlE [Planctomycetes bacterium Pan216]|uniref:DEAD-box ATP-dependent RNA helicase RhpA n=1 Tax=Kolteria novifilia TaxID=2527975 RepID=A0A518B371_9BACT|nr:ATP-dependent RNA helicase RhlE [Planctomycetes bacterium Pan216]